MAKNKFYAVAQGRKPGIYTDWFGDNGAEAQVRGAAGALYKGFASRHEAEDWIKSCAGLAPSQTSMPWGPEGTAEAPQKRVRLKAKKSVKEEAKDHPSPQGERIEIYSDGGCSKNPGPGGYGVVIIHDGKRRELSGGYARTTNNRMELMGCIKGLEALEEHCAVTVISDSQYVVNGIAKGWAKAWKKNNWKRRTGERAENSDLWARLLVLCEKHDVRFQWVRGHNGNPENERCDCLAVAMTGKDDLPPDHGYGK